MLNEQTLTRILNLPLPQVHISDIHWRSQDSDRESILFYKILPDEKSQKLFAERIRDAAFAWLIVNVDHPARPLNSSVINEVRWPEIQKQIMDLLYPVPPMKLFALTGTNGKTTTTDLVLQLGELCGKRGMSIGTLGVRELNKTVLDFGLTSPSFIDLRKFLCRYGKGKDFCVLEASSHALVQQRLYGLKFDQGGWLSFSQDHLDYHQNMENYFAAKMLMFDYLKDAGRVFVPAEQEELFKKIRRMTERVEKTTPAEGRLPLFFTTTFNRNNLEVAKAIVEKGLEVNVSVDLNLIVPPDGRFFIRPCGSSYIVVDFAHTPDALENICRGIREAFPGYKFKVLFGCGGDRDRTKRPLMGKIAESFADEIYLTSDNPRSEDPARIIEDILSGMSAKNIHRITDRPEAVRKAFSELGNQEVLLLAGKGHEDYILRNGVKYPYSDITEVETFLQGKKP